MKGLGAFDIARSLGPRRDKCRGLRESRTPFPDAIPHFALSPLTHTTLKAQRHGR